MISIPSEILQCKFNDILELLRTFQKLQSFSSTYTALKLPLLDSRTCNDEQQL